MSLFKGREDLYAKRWESRDGGSGYAPVCLNEWNPVIYRKRGQVRIVPAKVICRPGSEGRGSDLGELRQDDEESE